MVRPPLGTSGVRVPPRFRIRPYPEAYAATVTPTLEVGTGVGPIPEIPSPGLRGVAWRREADPRARTGSRRRVVPYGRLRFTPFTPCFPASAEWRPRGRAAGVRTASAGDDGVA